MADTIKPNFGNFLLYFLAIVIGAIVILFLFSKDESKVNQSSSDASESAKIDEDVFSKPPDMQINTGKKYTANITTDVGSISIELFVKDTPITVNNFVFLAKKGFYDKTIFHRVLKGFMIQGGDPKGDGTGGPGYKFADEKITLDYKRGIVAMANSGPNTNGSQFFIMHEDYDLPKNYVIFGRVIKGMDTVDKIATAPVIDSGEKSTPKKPVKITKIDITTQ